MYLSRIIDDRAAGAGKRRIIIEKPIDQNIYILKAVFKCRNEKAAKELADTLINMREPMENTPEAPAPDPKRRGRPKQNKEGKTNA